MDKYIEEERNGGRRKEKKIEEKEGREDLENNCFQNMAGLMVGGRRIKCIRFGDDLALLAEEQMILKDMLLELNDSCEQYGMKVNANKTKTMVIGRKAKKHHNSMQDVLLPGPSTWAKKFPTAAGSRQSPVDIVTSLAASDTSLTSKPLSWKYVPENTRRIVNTGYGWRVDVDGEGSANLIKDAVVSELQRSIDFNSEVIQDLKQTIEQRDRKIGELERKVDDLEQYQRRQCVRIFGIEEEVGENTDKLVVELATNIGVELKVEDIDRSHRVGRTTSDGRPRPIIVKFCSYRKRSEVFFNKKRLKGSGMTLREDLTKKVGFTFTHYVSELVGGPIDGEYKLEQYHCHWGFRSDKGSEHTVDGQSFAGELHLVHWNSSKYESFGEAAGHPDGLAVLGVLLKVGKEHPEFQKIVELIPKIYHRGEGTDIEEPIDPVKLLPETYTYWTYLGSLTTPPCSESVTWILFKDAIEVSEEQLSVFRSLRCYKPEEACPCDELEGLIINNYRPPLPLGNRELRECGSA
ncbi:hypothetical protein ANN_00135 [Periplaneta americana]|uniref:Carbonic anhydrase n=1 Tax=Periplaneta americana TaxID=6978 RepID=A0ABQ8TT35_PERAM|nr:hypothetical protein ANN_00135 [Periplaneta americana]